MVSLLPGVTGAPLIPPAALPDLARHGRLSRFGLGEASARVIAALAWGEPAERMPCAPSASAPRSDCGGAS